jgi:hypothetical protein
MKYLKTYENFFQPYIEPDRTPTEHQDMEAEDTEVKKEIQDQEQEEQEAIEALAAGFVSLNNMPQPTNE